MGLWLALLFAPFLAEAGSSRVQSYLVMPGGHQLYVDHQPAAPGMPTMVLLNGLTYSTHTWNKFVAAMEKLAPGTGVLRYDMRGMGKTLLANALPVTFEIPLATQVSDLRQLLTELKVTRPALVGLSYGGGVALAFAAEFPQLAGDLVLMAPYTEAVAAQDQWIKSQVRATRIAYPFNPATDDELYDYFLRNMIYTTYPAAEPIVLENPFKLEAVFRMVQGIRKFEATKVTSSLPWGSVHLMIANQDQYLDNEMLESFWQSVPRLARASKIAITKTEHKIPEAIPEFAAAWVAEILKKNPKLRGGREFLGSTAAGSAKAPDAEVILPKASK